MEKTVPKELYTEEYFLTACEGFEKLSQGNFSERFDYAFFLADIKKGMRVLDIGAGRGEIAVSVAKAGANIEAIDYSKAAVKIARKNLKNFDKKITNRIKITKMDGRKLSFPDKSFDRVFMLDVVEHLNPKELKQVFLEIKRVIKPGGKIVIHTPNVWLIKPLYFFADIFFPWWKRHGTHINEQSYFSLHRELKLFGGKRNLFFKPRKNYYHTAVGGFKKAPSWVISWARLIDSFFENKIVSFAIYRSPLVLFFGTVLWAVVQTPAGKCEIYE
jgi:ubiquinone/menaquinone biosynthesis C-methylase UbiE